jgi:hypothetical protein
MCGEDGVQCTNCRDARTQECKYSRAGVVPVTVTVPGAFPTGPQVPYRPEAFPNGGGMGNS